MASNSHRKPDMMAKTTKPTKAELTEAFDMGIEARRTWKNSDPIPAAAYADGPLLTAWENGWRGQDAFEKSEAETDSMADKVADAHIASGASNDGFKEGESQESGVEQLESHGHNVTDPEVAESREEMSGLMTAFDNQGIQIVEEQWRNLSDNEQQVAAKWVMDMRTGNERPVPEFLMPYANDRLKQAAVTHFEKQEVNRKILVPCRFGKPSAIIPSGDEGEDAIKMTVMVPNDAIERPSVAEDFLWDVHVKIEFSQRSVDKWEAQLPGCETYAEIVACETEIPSYNRLKKGRKFSFKISTDLIDDNTARTYANQQGSCRIELIGKIKPKAKAEPATVESIANAYPIPAAKPIEKKGKSLFAEADSVDVSYRKQLDAQGRFVSPDEYMVPIEEKCGVLTIYVGESGNSFYASRSAVFIDDEDVEQEADWGNPAVKDPATQKAIKGFETPSLAIQEEIKRMIDYGLKNKMTTRFLNEMRDELKRLETGGEPHLLPEGEEDDRELDDEECDD